MLCEDFLLTNSALKKGLKLIPNFLELKKLRGFCTLI